MNRKRTPTTPVPAGLVILAVSLVALVALARLAAGAAAQAGGAPGTSLAASGQPGGKQEAAEGQSENSFVSVHLSVLTIRRRQETRDSDASSMLLRSYSSTTLCYLISHNVYFLSGRG